MKLTNNNKKLTKEGEWVLIIILRYAWLKIYEFNSDVIIKSTSVKCYSTKYSCNNDSYMKK